MIPFRKIVFYTVFFVSVIFIILFILNRFESVMMTGELSRGHETLKDSCSDCHTPYRNNFNACVKCHDEITNYSLHRTEKGLSCVYCHNSHSSKTRKPIPEKCLSKACHESFGREKEHSADIRLCLKCHPEHLLKRKSVKTSSVKFSHREHSDRSKANSFSECVFCHGIAYDGGGILKPLGVKQCKRCHQKIIKEHKKERSFLTNDCYLCHFSQKREFKSKVLQERLKYANFQHDDHFAMPCTLCHFRMRDFTNLEDIKIFSSGKKYRLCTRCHPHVPYTVNGHTLKHTP